MDRFKLMHTKPLSLPETAMHDIEEYRESKRRQFEKLQYDEIKVKLDSIERNLKEMNDSDTASKLFPVREQIAYRLLQCSEYFASHKPKRNTDIIKIMQSCLGGKYLYVSNRRCGKYIARFDTALYIIGDYVGFTGPAINSNKFIAPNLLGAVDIKAFCDSINIGKKNIFAGIRETTYDDVEQWIKTVRPDDIETFHQMFDQAYDYSTSKSYYNRVMAP